MQIQLTKDFLGNPAGHRLDVSEHDGQSLLSQGLAQPVGPIGDDPLAPVLERSIRPALESSVEKALARALRATSRGKSLPFAGLGDQVTDDPRAGFKNFGDFALAVRDACQPGKRPDDRLAAAQKSPAGMNEVTPADGGFLVPTYFAQKILERVFAANNLLAMTDTYMVSGNSMAFPRNAETSRANGSRWGGVRAYWRNEGDQATSSFPTFSRLTLTLSKLFVMVHASDELLSDTAGAALEQYLTRVAGEEINFVVSDAILNGSGSGQPLGILSAPCLLTVAKDSGQTAATVTTSNIANMWSRLWAGCRSNAVWLINQEVESQLQQMTVGSGASTLFAYLPPGGLADKPQGTLLGRPVIPVEWCAALGTVGDVVLADMRQYVTISRGLVESALSIHLRFDYDESTFRFIFRVDGQPWWSAALTPYKGTNTQSCFVALATRS
jgi:HK97 family phage major capsid protein